MMHTKKNIQGYQVLEKLGEGIFAKVFKVHPKDKPGHIFVLKKIRKRPGVETRDAYLGSQVDIFKDLDLQGVISPFHFSSKGNRLFLIQEWFDGINLSDWQKTGPEIELPAFFKIACSIAKIVGEVHNAGFFHGGIKPNNILVNPETLDLRLIDHVRVIDINEISHFVYDEGFRTNALSYISPEQTGRIRHYVSYGTDFYSIGVVLYELLWGKPPFASHDPLEIIHSHLAQMPPFPKNDRNIPEVVKNIIARLLEKEPERRYQTGKGLLHDLMRCKKEFEKTGKTVPFTLGLKDHADRINTLSIMVGRDKEKKLLLKEHDLSCSGEFRSAIISGLPGIGKTRLIQELEIPIVSGRGYFTSGKFEKYKKNIPYSTLIQALSNLIRTFLTEDPDRVEYWKKTIESALGHNGRLIIDMIPELELIIGVQPQIVTLPPTEAKNRFNDTIDRFISCLAEPEHPLTFFIDDLQWCDRATFDVIESLFINSKNHPYLFLLGAYRHNEVDAGHPLRNLLSRVTEMKSPLTKIRLNELEPAHTNEMIAYTLGASSEQTDTLTGIVHVMSEGNPLYVNETLTWFHKNNLIYPDKGGDWQWDTEKITKSPIPGSAEKLFRSKILGIPEDSLKILQIAACLGVRFRIEDLSMVTGRDTADIFKKFTPVFSQRILIKKKELLSFFHDRVQEAVDSTLDEKSRQDIHTRIAEAYIEAIPEGSALETLDNLFDIVEHLNKGENADTDNKNSQRDAKLYHSAGKKAYSALSFEAANLYFRKSAAFLDETIWDREYEFVYSLYKDLAMSELSIGNQNRAQVLLDTLLDKSKTDLDKAECLADQAANLSSLGEFQMAIELSIQGLAYLGKSIPENEEDVDIRIDELGRVIKEKNVSTGEIVNREILSNRRDLIELGLYNHLIPSYYLLGKANFFLAGLEATYLCLSVDIHELAIYPFGIYLSFLLEQGDYEKAFIYEDLLIQLCRKFPNTFGAIRGLALVNWISLHWRHHPSFILKFSLESIDVGKESCDTHHTGLVYCAAFWSAVLQGNDLKIVKNLVSECKKYSIKYNLPFFSEGMVKGIKAAWIEPMKTAGVSIDITNDIDRWKQSNDITLLGNYYFHSGMTRYYLGDYEAANEHLKNGEDCLTGHTHNIPNREWHIFYALNSIRLLRETPAREELNAVMSKIQPIIEKIELWDSFGPALKPYLAFIQAEIKSVTGNFSETRKLYLDAIDIAHEQEYTLLEGHINECLGKLLSKRGINQAHFHLNEAAGLYKKCHATAKMELISEAYPEYILPHHEEKPEEAAPSQKLDTVYMMKAAGAISGELQLDELLKTIIKSVMEGLGAQQGYIIMEEGNSLMVRARGVKDETIDVCIENEPLNQAKGISRAIIRSVQRTKESVILENAMEKGPFVGDGEVQRLKLHSVLCLPILRRQKLVGIIYLQNNLIKSMFSGKHVELVGLLASQAAISLENAGLIEDMKVVEEELARHRDHLEELVKKRTAQLEAAQEELVRKERFATLGKLTATVSHEIRNPLGTIRTSLYSINERARGKSLGMEKVLARAERSIIRCDKIIEELLDYTRTRSLDPEPTIIDDWLMETLDELVVPEGVTLARKLNSGVEIPLDREHFRRCLVNIMDNAIKAIQEKREAMIATGNDEAGEDQLVVESLESDERLEVRITDTGTGIPFDQQEKIFEPLFSSRGFGIGLGLPTVKQIMERHGGGIKIKSAAGRGTTATLWLLMNDSANKEGLNE